VKKFVLALLASIVALGLLAPTASASRNRPATVVDSLVQVSGTSGPDRTAWDFDLLIAAASAVKVPGTETSVATFLTQQPSITVWAPNDAAFRRLATELGCTTCGTEAATGSFLLGLDQATLFTVLAYHVTPEALNAFQVLGRRTFNTLLPDQDLVRHGLRLQDADTNDRDASITLPLNLVSGNGIVHAVSEVLRPIDLP
jgi:uncharacterized surface protein with fasciclin (FAS1) repeats